jgi:hypothetical protein
VLLQAVIPVKIGVDHDEGMKPGIANKKGKTGAGQSFQVHASAEEKL